MAATLVIVDMQDGFYAAQNKYTINAVIAEIKDAIRRKAGIVVVQAEGFGRTIDRLERLLDKYDNVDYVWKEKNDGGREVYDSVIANGFDYRYFRVCGVNTEACVCETVMTLAEDMLPDSQIEVIEDACNSQEGYNDFSWMRCLNNVELVESKF